MLSIIVQKTGGGHEFTIIQLVIYSVLLDVSSISKGSYRYRSKSQFQSVGASLPLTETVLLNRKRERPKKSQRPLGRLADERQFIL